MNIPTLTREQERIMCDDYYVGEREPMYDLLCRLYGPFPRKQWEERVAFFTELPTLPHTPQYPTLEQVQKELEELAAQCYRPLKIEPRPK